MLRIAGDDKPAEVVRSRLKKLNADHIRFVLDSLAENTAPVRKHEAISAGNALQCAHHHEPLLSEQNEPRLCARFSEGG